jgi:phosphate-selective porin OprO/OprP
VSVLALATPPAAAQSPPGWPTPAPTPVAPPTPEPDEAPSSATSTPVSDAADPEGQGDPAAASSEPDIPSVDAGEVDDVVNPGDVAFTDYQPFDIEGIEEQPIKSKWDGFVAGVKGITRYNLFDGKIKFRLGARAQLDGTSGFEGDQFLDNYSAVKTRADVRRGLIFAAGRIFDFNFNLGFNFGADAGVDSAWVEGAKGGLEVWGFYLGRLRLGWFSEPFSLERKTSAYFTSFMERSLPVTTFAPGSNLGAMIHDSRFNDRFAWQAGIFSLGNNNESNASGSLLSLTARTSYLLVYRDEGRQLVHVGLSGSTRSPTSGELSYATRPEARFVGFVLDTGDFAASRVNLVAAEFAAVRGPLWVAAEYIGADVSAPLEEDPYFWGTYGQVGWFVTGESRNYRTNSGTFDRILPKGRYVGGDPFVEGASGAIEVVGRLSYVDLTDGLIEGGEMTNISGGVNWYVTETTRFEFNYIHTMPKDRGSANIFLIRIQYMPW